jgi:phenylpropionate dioxygenase-like ring-hydroxylating dioxygenase large terminal subunit
MEYLTNAWYALAWSDEVNRSLVHRKLLDRDVVMFRDSHGIARALGNRCPHRFAPLHLGTLSDDVIQCPYHGLKYNTEGLCIHNPHGDGRIPKGTAVPSYPIVERHLLIWIWMGRPELADQSTIPDFGYVGDPNLVTIKGQIQGSGHYELYSDNIMDLGHAEFLHTGLGAPAFTKGAREFRQEGNTVWSTLASPATCLSPLHAQLKQLEDRPMDWWVDVRWDPPASMDLTLYVSEIGGSRETARWIDRTFHIMTPETGTSTRYFWAFSRNYRLHDEPLTVTMRAGIEFAFENEDKPMIAAQQTSMGNEAFWDLAPVLLSGDIGAVRARRVLAKLISAQQSATSLQKPSALAGARTESV